VRRGGRDKQRLDRRAHDRAARGEAVGGGPGGRGRDHRVGRVADERLPAHQDRHGGAALAGDAYRGHVVEGGDHHRADRRVDGQPRLDGEVLAVDGRQRGGQLGHVDLGEESELAEVDPEHQGRLPVGQPHRPQHRPVPAQADHQVAATAKLARGDRRCRAVQPLDLLPDAKDMGLVPRRPAKHCLNRLGRITLRMQDKPDRVHRESLSTASSRDQTPRGAESGTALRRGSSTDRENNQPYADLG
jgi:hypothetical protein